MKNPIRIERIKMPDPFPPIWTVTYRHPIHGVLIRPRRDHADAIEYADKLRVKGRA